ncbi:MULTISPECIES: LysR family transcriptional regulator [Stenotrophomonas]|uniref:LysR family transcriptional regulator n=1 Tax=Stenotrophomonas lactitubi TaxID=2045214 RepID=A0AAW4GKJ4_9GAMM|nr:MULTISPECIES: LysR family transcriptional regulator [Stenotrophomonas]MBM9914537.1 LysR family transcriptional regulator [Stenotrophomonas lactitubi]MBM9922842.1 LysR family transcriptional regulator [Stenotrophomonas lactitubi]MBM9938666.1 LysR family transcriptional regulator [Stenotrophomonas lactitubi]
MRMNLHHLAIFHAIAETGSISAAAGRVHVSQPALSRELKDFEGRLGVVLFERLPRGMRLTEPGKVLHAYSARLFAVADSAQAAMRDFADARTGQLSIGASNTVGTYVLPRLVANFRSTFPQVGISLFVGNTEQVAQGVADLRFTLGFVEGPIRVEGIVAKEFSRDELVPVVAAQHPLAGRKRATPSDINGLPLLMREPGSGTRELITELLRQLNATAGSIVEFSNTEALKQAAIHGGGIAWLPGISVTRDLQDGSLVRLPIDSLAIERSFSIIRREGAYEVPAVDAFVGMIQTSSVCSTV